MLSRNEEIENVTFQALAHPVRRTIIRIVQSRSQGVTYMELLTELGLSTGKLNYHLEQLRGVLEKNSSNTYVLTSFGKKAVEHLYLIEQKTNVEDEKYVKIAVISQKASLQPIMKGILLISIAVMSFFIALWGYVGYIAIMEGAPMVVYVLLAILFAIGASVLGLIVYAMLKAPLWLKRFEQRFLGDY